MTIGKERFLSNDSSLVKYQELKHLFGNSEFAAEMRDVLDSPFEVMLMAPMSSGKSTLINAMIGFDLLPTANQACTATVYRIEDNDTMKKFKCRAIYQDRKTRKRNASLKVLREWNAEAKCDLVEIEGNLPFIRNAGANLVIYDTPGPNYSLDKRHQDILSKALTNYQFGVMVFLLNANHLGTTDERSMLNQILELQKKGDKFKKKIAFVISKADQLDEEDGESLEEVVARVDSYLQEIGFKDPIIIPIMGEAALLARKLANGLKLTRHERADLTNYYYQLIDSPRYTVNATKIDKEIIDTIEDGILGNGQQILQSKSDKNEFQVGKKQVVTRLELSKFLYSTGLLTLEQYFENLITQEALHKNMDNIRQIFEKYDASSLLNWLNSK